jgi:beta-lactam-binding protein with PASTA domain
VPHLVGYQVAKAVAMLRQAGLTPIIREVASVAPNGRVVGQAPQAGSKQPEQSRVLLNVSLQPPVVVPNVVGLSGLAAHHTLTADHLVAFLRYVPSAKPPRTVIAQHPLPGEKVKRGTSIEINISTGPGPTGPTGTSTGPSGTTGPSGPTGTSGPAGSPG